MKISMTVILNIVPKTPFWKKTLYFSIFVLVILLASCVFKKYQPKIEEFLPPKEQILELQGVVKFGNDLNPPRDYCKEGIYLSSKTEQPVFQDRSSIQLRDPGQASTQIDLKKFLDQEVKLKARYDKDKVLCKALLCSCEDYLEILEISLKTERQLGYLKKIEENENGFLINFEPANWLSEIDGSCFPESSRLENPKNLPECNPNGFLIQKQTSELIKLFAEKQTEVFMQTLNHNPDGGYNWDEKISLTKLKEVLEKPESIYLNLPFWLQIENDQVIRITEQYLP